MSRSSTRILGLLVVVIAAAAVVVSLAGTAVLRAAGESSTVGYIYSPKIAAAVEGTADYAKARTAFEEYRQKLVKEYESQAEGLDQETKSAKAAELDKKLAAKQTELNKPFQDKIQKAIEEVAKEQGVSVVLSERVELEAIVPVRDKDYKVVGSQAAPISFPVVVSGGKNLTDLVIKKLGIK